MKKAVVFLFMIIIFAGLSPPALAADPTDTVKAQKEALGVDELERSLPGDAADIMGDMSVEDALDIDGTAEIIVREAGYQLGGIVKTGLRSGAVIVISAILCSLAASVYDESVIPSYIPLTGAVVVSAVAVGDVKAFIGLGAETLEVLSGFSKVLLPALAAASTASGALTAGTAKFAATAFFMDILLSAAIGIVMPLVYAYIAVTIADAAMGNQALKGIASLLKWLCTSILTALVIAFTAYLGITGVITSSADAVATRLAKTTIATTLPVVGSIISDAAGTVLAGASVLRNSIGIFGMIAVICICLTPFLTLGVQYIMYKLAAGITEALSNSGLGKLISGIGTAFGIVLGLTGAGAMMIFISIISCIKVVGGG